MRRSKTMTGAQRFAEFIAAKFGDIKKDPGTIVPLDLKRYAGMLRAAEKDGADVVYLYIHNNRLLDVSLNRSFRGTA